jgi:hypothetical protein
VVSIQEPYDLNTEHDVDMLRHEVQHLQVAVTTRDLIGQAKGVLRFLARCSDLTAFNTLAYLSQATNRKVTDVAAQIMDAAASGTPVPADLSLGLRRALIALGADPAVSEHLTGPRTASPDPGWDREP